MGFDTRTTISNLGMTFGATLAGLVAAGAASAQTTPIPLAPTFQCRELPIHPDPDLPVLKPIFRSMTDLSEDEFDCLRGRTSSI